MKIIHCSDLHLGVTTHGGGRIDPATGLNVRVADFAARWLDCCQAAVDEQVDTFLFAGDAFNTRTPDAGCLEVFARGVKLVADAGIPMVLLIGNHESAAVAGRAHALSIFETLNVPNVHVAAEPQVIWLNCPGGQLAVACLPWPTKGWTADYLKGASLADRDALLGAYLETEIKSLAERAAWGKSTGGRAVLLAHIGVTEAQASGEAGMMLGREVQLPLSVFRRHAAVFDYVALGHYHAHQTWPANRGLVGAPWITYAGSLDRVDFGEADEPKGWLLVEITETGRTVAHVAGRKTAARRFVTVEVDCRELADPTAGTLAAIAAQGDLTGCVVRMRVRLNPEQEVLLNINQLTSALSAAWQVAPLEKLIERPVRMRLGIDAPEIASLTSAESLERFFNLQVGLSDERKAVLLEVGTKLMQDVDQES